jgi:hypothetical protein
MIKHDLALDIVATVALFGVVKLVAWDRDFKNEIHLGAFCNRKEPPHGPHI